MQNIHHDCEVTGLYQRGLTLVEMSMVLVVVALIISGILVGRTMINASNQRGVIKEVEAINTATTSFKLKYGGLPGDMSRAAQFGIPMHACVAQTIPDNGKIEFTAGGQANCSGSYACSCEQSRFAHQLYSVGMVKNKLYSSGNNGLGYVLMSGYGDHYYIPYTWYNIGGTGAALGDDGVHWLSAERSSLNGYFYLPNSWLSDANGYTPFASAVAGQIDGKIDDGLPLTGNVRMISAGPTNANLGVMNAGYPEYGNCATTNVPATSRYKSEDSKVFASGRMGCRLGFKSQF